MIEMTTSLARSLATLTGFENHLLSGLGPPGWTKVECWSGRGNASGYSSQSVTFSGRRHLGWLYRQPAGLGWDGQLCLPRET